MPILQSYQASSIKHQASSIKHCLIFLCGCVFSVAVSAQSIIKVYNWDDYIDQTVLEDFEKETGIKIDYHTFGSEREIRQLIDSNTLMDVAVVPHFSLPHLMEEQRLNKLNPALLSNQENLDAFILSRMSLLGANGYAMPYLWGSVAFGFNRPLTQKILGADFKEDWSLLFDPSKNAQLNSCGMAMADAPYEIYAALLDFKGSSDSLDRVPLARFRRFFNKSLLPIRSNLRYIDSARYFDGLGKGDLCLVAGWSSGILHAMQRNQDVQAVFPEDSTLTIIMEALVIPRTSQNPAAAHQLIDFLLRFDVSARNVEKTLSGSPLKNIGSFLKPELQNAPFLYIDEKIKSHVQLLESPGQAQKEEMDKLWEGFLNARDMR
ncbi:hypothetical protein AXE65_09305 [Ventosimonas gracilis]|uniref:Putrescine-binding periplasmic protein n=1 Tax=Ventosimonas gracilis TaxID=1680762 RepID=A0A139SXB1_9GAMM|nr:extracellular solute-binding protein [Ventosimonas gracilis]KXU39263.1 hypothetical protein AXE65_09305 [Ventosimonas gracilis]